MSHNLIKRLAGATLLIFANKQDISGAMTSKEIEEVRKENNFMMYNC
jgi:hypothetical protein